MLENSEENLGRTFKIKRLALYGCFYPKLEPRAHADQHKKSVP